MKFFRKIKLQLGELWWYALVLFVMQRMGDFINAFIGLWLVPKYVPAAELGAVLPLTAVGGMLGLPISILMIPFMKFLNTYMTRGEYGKVKALLRDMFVAAGAIFLVISVAAHFFMPFIFTRMRVENGRLALLVLLSGVLVAVTPIFATALQAVKQFKMLSFLGFGGGVVRLLTLLVALPIRGLSGYFLGQIVPSVTGAVVTVIILWRQFLSNVKTESYWSDDSGKIFRYTLKAALLSISGSLAVFGENFVIRHRLPDFESAGYYMVSRFAEIAFYFGATVALVLFPLISELKEKEGKSIGCGVKLVRQSMLVTLAGGGLLVLVLWLSGGFFFGWVEAWKPYKDFRNIMVVLTGLNVLRGVLLCFTNYCLADNRFRFVLPFAVVGVGEFIFLYGITGYDFFARFLPEVALASIRTFNPCRLDFIVLVMFVSTFVLFGYSLFVVYFRRRLKEV